MKHSVKTSIAITPLGCSAAGGITTLLQLLIGELERRGQGPRLIQGWWPRLAPQLVVLGCANPWAYLQLLRHRLAYPDSTPQWVPCFHPPAHVRHSHKARMALWALRLAQRCGIAVLTLSQCEQQHLDAGRSRIISLGFSRAYHQPSAPVPDAKPVDLVFLGRPTEQKGWPLFVEVVQLTGLNALAYIPFEPAGELQFPVNLEVVVAATDAAVQQGLRLSKLLLLPADYESFGFAQAEALAMGCCVPVLGEWPLWLGIQELDWRGLSASVIAEHVRALVADRQNWIVLQRRQQDHWSRRIERQAPLWP